MLVNDRRTMTKRVESMGLHGEFAIGRQNGPMRQRQTPAYKGISPSSAPTARGTIAIRALPPRMAGNNFARIEQVVGGAVGEEEQEQAKHAIPNATPKGGLKGGVGLGLGLCTNINKADVCDNQKGLYT